MTRPYSETLAAAEGGIPRHYCRCKDCAFTEPLAIPGWEERSVWGYDYRRESFVARLWRNGSRARTPLASLPDGRGDYRWPACLAVDLVAVTGMEPIAVLTALVLLDPAARLRTASEIEALIDSPPGVSEEYRDGYRRALLWVLGAESICPGSRNRWSGGRPTAQRVDAESQLLFGRGYSHEVEEIINQQFNGGGHAALESALGRGYDASGKDACQAAD